MKTVLILLVLLSGALASISDLKRALVRQTQAHECRTCIEGSTKWCRLGSDNTEGECCASNDFSGYCSGSGDYICSDDSTRIENNTGTILCPLDDGNWGMYTIDLPSVGSTRYRNTTMASNTVWVYKIQSYSSSIDEVKLSVGMFRMKIQNLILINNFTLVFTYLQIFTLPDFVLAFQWK